MAGKALYTGSFDPMTSGHLDIITRASHLFDEVIVVILENSEKRSAFTLEERLQFMKAACAKLANVRIDHDTCLTVEYARKHGASAIIRGVRSVKDYEYERDIASINQHMAEDIETILLFASPSQSFVSSTIIREMVRYGQDISAFVNDEVRKACVQRLKDEEGK